jgi:hypothetical protein
MKQAGWFSQQDLLRGGSEQFLPTFKAVLEPKCITYAEA